MLRDALTYPARGQHTEHLFLRGLVLAFAVVVLARLPGVLSLAVLLPVVLLLGVLVGVYHHSVTGHTEPPRGADVSTVVRRGVTIGVLCVVYLAPAVGAVVITLVGARTSSTSAESLEFLSTTSVLLGSTAVLGLALGSAYLLPVAVGRVLETGSLRAGVDVRALVDRSVDGAYFTAFGAATALLLVTAGLAGALASVGRVGGAVGVVLTFHVLVSATYLVGRGFGTAGTVADLL